MADYTILGAGSMGTAMSFLIGSNNYDVLMWARRKEVADAISKKRVNAEYMPQLVLPEKVRASTDIKECVESSNNIILAVPSHGVVEVCKRIRDYEVSEKLWLSVVKGMDTVSRRTISHVLQDELGIGRGKIAVLSGPNFAVEIVENMPTVGVLGCKSSKIALKLGKALITEHFMVKMTRDLAGVEIGGVLKNIGAIAIGVVDGSNLGDNTRGLIFSGYMEEALEIGVRIFEAEEATLLGPACLGDMITTAFSLKSRNRIVGLLASKCITNIPKDTFIAEGRNNARIVRMLARKHNIGVPITEFVDSVLAGVKPIVAFNNLWDKMRKDSRLR